MEARCCCLRRGLEATARIRISKIWGIVTISYNYNQIYSSGDSNTLFYSHLYVCVGQRPNPLTDGPAHSPIDYIGQWSGIYACGGLADSFISQCMGCPILDIKKEDSRRGNGTAPFATGSEQTKNRTEQPSLYHKCGTSKLANSKFTMLTTPSPRISPLASTITAVSSRRRYVCQYQLTKPPIVRASVNDGVLYMPTATAIPPGIHACQRRPCPAARAPVRAANTSPAPSAHCHAISGRPCPVTSRAVKIHTYPVGTWNMPPGTSYTLV